MRFSCSRARSNLPRAPALTRFRPLAYTEVRAGAYRPQHVSDRGCSCNRLLCCTRHRWRRAPRPCPAWLRRANRREPPQAPASWPRRPHAVTESLRRVFATATLRHASRLSKRRCPGTRNCCDCAEPAPPPARRWEQQSRPREGAACGITTYWIHPILPRTRGGLQPKNPRVARRGGATPRAGS